MAQGQGLVAQAVALVEQEEGLVVELGGAHVRAARPGVVGGGEDGFTKKQWAVCDRRLMKELFMLVYITKPQVLQSQLDNPLIDMYTAYADFGIGWGDARQIIFSNPA